jgi:hypothetical protein
MPKTSKTRSFNMSAIILLLVLGVWVAIWYYTGYGLSFFLVRIWLRRVAGTLLVLLMTGLAIGDEILGAREFDALCMSARTFQIPTDLEGKNFNVQFSRTEKNQLHGLWRQVWWQTSTYVDTTSGKVIATGKTFSTTGGVLVKLLGINPLNGGSGPLLGGDFCYPAQHADQVKRLRAMVNIDIK